MDIEMKRPATGPTIPVVVESEGPWLLYEFDGDLTDDAGFEKLEPKRSP